MLKKLFFRLSLIFFTLAVLYGLGRLYFQITGGFTLSNITSDFSYNPEWEVRNLTPQELAILDNATLQPYYYLGKGCQSYVFLSEDGNYVIKFFKYQRYRLQSWLTYFPPLPAIVKYREEKQEKKLKKLDGFVKSWKVAFENLKDETGLIAVHLNKTLNLKQSLTIYDKIGQSHRINLDEMEFCIQRRADMLCTKIESFKEKNDIQSAQNLIVALLHQILSEYKRGLADNDHALMQNTGVLANGNPVHIDVGQFVINEQVKNPEVYKQELFTKTYKFKLWLRDQYPELATFLDHQLAQIIGPAYPSMKPKFRERTKHLF